MRFFTSDLHFGHANISRFCGRPFGAEPEQVEAMNEAIIFRWNMDVGPEDEVIVVGDVAMGRIAETLPLVQRLNGRKILYPGNHDRCMEGMKSLDRWIPEYEAVGFEIAEHVGRIDVGGHSVQVCHFPYDSTDYDEDRERRPHRVPDDDGSWLIHGHVHDLWRVRGRQINVGWDAWGGYPVPDHDIVMILDSPQRDLDGIRWQ